ncbi:hypothetical protein [Xanthobacter agilis]|uniref:hypothetical protein n=1 Tax=Xanthobacter agilis TaxID=47492 RepID=UPI00372BCEE1
MATIFVTHENVAAPMTSTNDPDRPPRRRGRKPLNGRAAMTPAERQRRARNRRRIAADQIKETRDPIAALGLILDRFDRIVRMDMDEADPVRDRLFQELFAAESALGNVRAALFDSERRRLAALDVYRNQTAP